MSNQEREYGQDDFRSASAEVQAAEAELAAAQARLDAARARVRAAAQQTGQQAESQSGAQFGSQPSTQPSPQYPGAQPSTQPGAQQTGQQPGYYTYRVYYDQPSQGTYQTYQGSYSNSYPNNYQDPYRQNPQSQNFQSYTAISTKDHVAAGLLAIFIGSLGIHKFYLGYNSTGFIMLAITVLGGLLTLGLAASVMVVIALIEGIIYLTKSQTDFEQIYVLNKREWF